MVVFQKSRTYIGHEYGLVGLNSVNTLKWPAKYIHLLSFKNLVFLLSPFKNVSVGGMKMLIKK